MMVDGMHYNPKCICKNCERITKQNNNNMPYIAKNKLYDKGYDDGVKAERERIIEEIMTLYEVLGENVKIYHIANLFKKLNK